MLVGSYQVRSFQLSDYVAVTCLLESVLTEDCYEETMEAFARQLSWDSELVLVAEQEGEIVGIIVGTIDNHNGYYYRIAVEAEHQRRGIGQSLIESLRQRFIGRKVRRILVTVDAHNEVVLPVYEKAGYQAADFSRAPHRLSIVNG
ncbi:GCN5-like N-acetyltransferase [Paenibacillus mucilaginosus 3016]|uniref:GCN5-like N-acetyltransferase n=2 Tax=Paenibacillus mucilaginosus TaxID=61624 RepID=H6NSM6_9BACL|nr:GNAT family N-acetyltransferase [Paenibacillus mucilaginosus]AFC27447.1 GCN5-like N-acetyltransferase [Paenibacillus mucilaginosus 3016]AFH59594.1 acetyltransferase GCN5 [Paenibacillus mucilaginosus K02]WFA16351.1 GNAT family N-acetyltransferase [Paenibacillus mucilaginosus]